MNESKNQPPRIYSTDEIADSFLDFYQSKGFQKIDDSGVIPENDPTLLFINSGMAPPKTILYGRKTTAPQPTYKHPKLCPNR